MFNYITLVTACLYGCMRYGMFGKHQIVIKREQEHMEDISDPTAGRDGPPKPVSQSIPIYWSYGLFEGFSGFSYDRNTGLASPENGWVSHRYFRPVDVYFQEKDGQCFKIEPISKRLWILSRALNVVLPESVEVIDIPDNENTFSIRD